MTITDLCMKVYSKNSVKNIGWNVEDFLPSPEHGNRKGKKKQWTLYCFRVANYHLECIQRYIGTKPGNYQASSFLFSSSKPFLVNSSGVPKYWVRAELELRSSSWNFVEKCEFGKVCNGGNSFSPDLIHFWSITGFDLGCQIAVFIPW